MHEETRFVTFRLDGQRYALGLETVQRIVRAVEVTPLPDAPAIVLGVVDMAGTIIPVLNLRRRFGLPERAIGPEDQLLVARTDRRTVALVVDEAQGVIERLPAEVVESERIVPGVGQIQGVIRMADGLVLIHDLGRFLSLDEAQALDAALNDEADDASRHP